MKKKIYALGSILMTFIFLLAISVAACAAENEVPENAAVSYFAGNPSSHPYRYTTDKVADSVSQIVLNAYTSAAPVDGTPVTTWKYTGSSTQEWGGLEDIEITAVYNGRNYGGFCISSNANPDVALNINRAYDTPEVNTYTIVGNKFLDIAVNREGDYLYVERRGRHSGKMYLHTTSSIANSGGGKYLQWNPAPTSFYVFDIPYNTFT